MNTKTTFPILSRGPSSDLAQDRCTSEAQKRSWIVVRLQLVTLAWMLIECGVALISAWRSHSAALLAFGSDSLVELLPALVVLMQFTLGSFSQERPFRFVCHGCMGSENVLIRRVLIFGGWLQ